MRNPLGDVERCEAAESGIAREGDLQRTRRQTVSKLYQLYQVVHFSYSNIIPPEIHSPLLPEIPVNGGPFPTMMRLPAIHDQV
eukprot:COSAG05_NODE_3936_length_1765_cov_3.830732_1_plen_83_part_00